MILIYQALFSATANLWAISIVSLNDEAHRYRYLVNLYVKYQKLNKNLKTHRMVHGK